MSASISSEPDDEDTLERMLFVRTARLFAAIVTFHRLPALYLLQTARRESSEDFIGSVTCFPS